MNRSLWLLIGLQLRAWLRSLVRSLRSFRGAALALLGLFVLIPWLILVWKERGTPIPPEQILTGGPAFLIAYCLMNVLLSTGERAVYFSPAEVTFLFTGPFRRRELLVYRVVYTLLVSIPTTLLFTAISRANTPWVLAGFVGLLQMFIFMQLFGMAISLAATSIGARLYSKARALILAAAVMALALALLPLRSGGFNGLLASSAWHVISTPLRAFFEAYLAQTWGHLLLYAAQGLLVNFLMLTLVLGLDSDYMEASAAYSQRVYAQLQRLRGGPAVSGGRDGVAPPPRPRFSVPMLPRLGGVGPLIWRQLTTAIRTPSRLVGLVVAQVVLPIFLVTSMRDTPGTVQLPAGILIFVLSIFLTTMVPFDFRGDLDRLESLKTLPLSPGRVALGQILPPALIMSTVQGILLCGLTIFELVQAPEDSGTLTDELLMLVGAALFALPFNFILIGLENVLFLLFPSRLMAGTSGDFQTLGRGVLLLIAKLLTLLVVGGTAALAGVVVSFANGGSVLLGLVAVWTVLVAGAAAFVPIAGQAFRWLDVTRDKPA